METGFANWFKEDARVMNDILSILQCPATSTPLVWADSELLSQLNEAIDRGEIINQLGQRVESRLQKGLVNSDRSLLYIVVDEIPQMVIDESIPLDQVISRS